MIAAIHLGAQDQDKKEAEDKSGKNNEKQK